MKINNLIYIVLLGIIVSLTSCEDDDSLFSGNENYITSFRLVQQGDSYGYLLRCWKWRGSCCAYETYS